MIIKNIHEKLLNGIQTMLIDTKINMPYYGNFNLHVNFKEQDSIGTCAVNVTSKGMNFFYSPKFLENLSQKEVNFIILHEDFHLLFNHPKRTITGQYNHKLSNIAQDMIINYVIWEDISHSFVEIPKDKNGKNMALFPPKEYDGKLIFEELYEWLKEDKEKWEKEKKEKKECDSCKGTGKKTVETAKAKAKEKKVRVDKARDKAKAKVVKIVMVPEVKAEKALLEKALMGLMVKTQVVEKSILGQKNKSIKIWKMVMENIWINI